MKLQTPLGVRMLLSLFMLACMPSQVAVLSQVLVVRSDEVHLHPPPGLSKKTTSPAENLYDEPPIVMTNCFLAKATDGIVWSGYEVAIVPAHAALRATILQSCCPIAPNSAVTPLYRAVEFAPPEYGIASPVFRSDPGFIGGGRTAGGAREFVIPNQPISPGATVRRVP
jgi:hypothetical protein